jgi:hypothetical protein
MRGWATEDKGRECVGKVLCRLEEEGGERRSEACGGLCSCFGLRGESSREENIRWSGVWVYLCVSV